MENSSFGENTDFFIPTDIVPLDTNGATSDSYKVRINGKWHFLKRPKQKYTNYPQYNAAFEKEFDLGYTLDHPNIVRYISKGKDKDGFYFLTEFVDGLTLKDFILNNPNYFKKKEHIQKFIEQLLSALSYLHKKQILHLDLKPENILITNIGNDVKIIDLGFAYSDCYQFLTIGKTNLYAALEQINHGKIDQRTDIYGFGMVLLYVFTQSTDKQLLNKAPLSYQSIVKKCLSVNSIDRFQDIHSIEITLKAYLLRKKQYITLGIIVLVITVGGVIFYLSQNKQSEIVDTIVDNDSTLLHQEQNPLPTESTVSELSKNKGETYKIISEPDIIELTKDSFYLVLKEKSKTELLKIYEMTTADVYSVEDQQNKFSQTQKLYSELTDPIEDREMKNTFMYIFWDEQEKIATPYFQKQALAYLDKAKKYNLPDSITQREQVYQLLDKQTADLFIPFVQKNQIITSNTQYRELYQLYQQYLKEKKSVYKAYKHLFVSLNDFEKGLIEDYTFQIKHNQNWADARMEHFESNR